jgi:hypothetical protein
MQIKDSCLWLQFIESNLETIEDELQTAIEIFFERLPVTVEYSKLAAPKPKGDFIAIEAR